MAKYSGMEICYPSDIEAASRGDELGYSDFITFVVLLSVYRFSVVGAGL